MSATYSKILKVLWIAVTLSRSIRYRYRSQKCAHCGGLNWLSRFVMDNTGFYVNLASTRFLEAPSLWFVTGTDFANDKPTTSNVTIVLDEISRSYGLKMWWFSFVKIFGPSPNPFARSTQDGQPC